MVGAEKLFFSSLGIFSPAPARLRGSRLQWLWQYWRDNEKIIEIRGRGNDLFNHPRARLGRRPMTEGYSFDTGDVAMRSRVGLTTTRVFPKWARGQTDATNIPGG